MAKRAVHLALDVELIELFTRFYRLRVDQANRAGRGVPSVSKAYNELLRRCEGSLRKVVEAEEAKHVNAP